MVQIDRVYAGVERPHIDAGTNTASQKPCLAQTWTLKNARLVPLQGIPDMRIPGAKALIILDKFPTAHEIP